MIGTIRKHSKWLWLVIIAATVVSFVIYFSPNQRFSDRGGGPGNYGTMNGKTITREQFLQAMREVELRYYFNNQEWPDAATKRTGFDLERETYFRLLLIQKQEELGIQVNSEAVAKIAAAMLRSKNRGNPVPLEAFEKQVLNPHGLTLADFEHFIRHDFGIQELISVTSLGSKLVTPAEARALYERENQEISVQAVFFSSSNHLASVATPPDAVGQFYTNHMPNYKLPERVQVSYVKFAISNYVAEATRQMAEVTNLNERVEATYAQLGTNYFAEAKTPEEKKEKIRELMFKNQLAFNARKHANEFASALLNLPSVKYENFAAQAKTGGLEVKLTEPFDQSEGPKEFIVGQDFVKAAFKLTPEEPFGDGQPLVGDDGVYVIALQRRLPSENPPFEAVREKVIQDYKHTQAVLQARNEGAGFHTALTNGLGAGKSFSAICLEAKQRPIMPPPFSPSTRALTNVEAFVNLGQFKQTAFNTPPGKASVFTPTSDGGFIVFVQSKFPLDETKLKADMPAFLNIVRQTRTGEAFNEWFRHEAERALREIPYFQQVQQPQMGAMPKKKK